MAKQLSGEQKFALGEWVRKHGELVTNKNIFWDALVEAAEIDLGFEISESSMKSYSNIVYKSLERKQRAEGPDRKEMAGHARQGKGIEIAKRALAVAEESLALNKRIAAELNIR